MQLHEFSLAGLLTCSTLLLPTALQSATTIELTNGDRLSGELVRLNENDVLLRSDLLGEIPLKVEQITNAQVLPPVPSGNAQAAGQTADAGPVAPAPAAEADGTAPEVTAADRPWWAFWTYQTPEKWSGEASFGVVVKTGNTESTDLNTGFELEWDRTEKDNLKWEGYYTYGEEDQMRTDDEWGLSMRYRHDISERWFVQSKTSNDTDQIANVNWDARQTVGIGYRVIMRENMELNVVPSGGVQYLDQPGEDGFFANAGVQEDFTWQIREHLGFEQDFEFLIDPSDSDIWSAEFNAALTTRMTEAWALRLGFTYEYDNATEPPAEQEDTETTASIVWTF